MFACYVGVSVILCTPHLPPPPPPLLLTGIKTLKEVDLAFIPYESRVFSLDYPKALTDFYAGRNLEKMADHLVTVCSMMEEYPHVRYHRSACVIG